MNTDLIKTLGRLGDRPHAVWIYIGLAYQLVVSALVFLFDAGFPAFIVIAGWIIFIFVIGFLAVKDQKESARQQQQEREEWQVFLSRQERLTELLKSNPHLVTSGETCRNFVPHLKACRINVPTGQKNFKFSRQDINGYCLLWQEKLEVGKNGKKDF